MDSNSIRYLNTRDKIKITANRLPHWEQSGTTNFLTFRLADSLPKSVLDDYRISKERFLESHPQPWNPDTETSFHQHVSIKLEHALDNGYGNCLLLNPENAQILEQTLLHFSNKRFTLLSFVIMPNHIHALFTPSEGHTITSIVHSWKRHSAHEINQRENRSGALWQRDYFDRIIRDTSHLYRCIKYIRNNPTKANLPVSNYRLWESDYAKQFT